MSATDATETGTPGAGASPDAGAPAGGAARRRFVAGLALVAGAGVILRVAYVLWVSPSELGFDAVWYQLQAGTIASGDGYVDPRLAYGEGELVPTANFPPLWPGLLAVADRLGMGTQQGMQLLGAVIGGVTIVLAGLVGDRVAGPATGLVTATVVAGSPLLVAADGSLMADGLHVALVTGAVLVALHAARQPRWSSFALLGLLLGLAALARSDALLLAPLLAAATAWRARDPAGDRPAARRAVGRGALVLVVMGLLLAPWSVRNSARLGEPVLLSSNSGSLLEGANCDGAYSGRLMGGWDASCLEETRRPGADEATWAAAGRSAGFRHARDHPWQLPPVAVVRAMRAWGLWHPVHQVDDLEVVESRTRGWQLLGWGYGTVTLVVALPGAVLLWRRRAALAPLAAVIAGVTVVAVVSWGNQRFRLAAEPAVAVAAATFLVDRVSATSLVERARGWATGG